jgi:Leucine-rich repeat (LRR) protein
MYKTVVLILVTSGLCLCPPARADVVEQAAALEVQICGGKVTRDETRPGYPVVMVDLSSQKVTTHTLRTLAKLKNLTTLDLWNTKVTDAGMKELATMKNLTTLDLRFTNVTDAGLLELAALKNLTNLDLRRTSVTDAGVQELQKALPKCSIQD